MQSDPAAVEAEGGASGVALTGYSGGEDARSRRRGAAVVPRHRLRPPIKAAIFLSIRGLGRVGTQRHPARTGGKRPPPFTAIIFTGLRSCCSPFWFSLPS